jgi:branched-chain amino acid transport system ATP-binding protein
MTELALEDVSKSFGGVAAVSEVSFAVPAGSIFALIGPNGAGKTTLFNLISGVYPPSTGRVTFADRDVTALPSHARARLGLARTFQMPQMFLNMSAAENVMVGAHRHLDAGLLTAVARFGRFHTAEKQCRAEAAALMQYLGLELYRHEATASLPYGALKRLEVARAMASRPRLLLLDEPAAGLNASEADEMMGVIRSIAGTGVTVILIEHNMRMVMGLAERVLVLVSGRMLVEGAPAEVQRHPDVIAAYLGAAPAPQEERRRA